MLPTCPRLFREEGKMSNIPSVNLLKILGSYGCIRSSAEDGSTKVAWFAHNCPNSAQRLHFIMFGLKPGFVAGWGTLVCFRIRLCVTCKPITIPSPWFLCTPQMVTKIQREDEKTKQTFEKQAMVVWSSVGQLIGALCFVKQTLCVTG